MHRTLGKSWSGFKTITASKGMSIQYDEDVWADSYYLFAEDDNITYDARVMKTDPRNADQIDFEDNYKASANARIDRTEDNPMPMTVAVNVAKDKTKAGNSVACASGSYTDLCSINVSANSTLTITSIIISQDTETICKILLKNVTDNDTLRRYWTKNVMNQVNDMIVLVNSTVNQKTVTLSLRQDSGSAINATGVMIATKTKG